MKLSIVAAISLLSEASSALLQSIFNIETLTPKVSSLNAKTIPNSYIIIFKNGYNFKEHISVFRETINTLDGSSLDSVKHIYNIGSLQGFGGRFGSKVHEELRKNPV
ncbi:hypothetical protein BGZ76_006228, partial [Entomortierella beljakovae]